MTTMWPSKDKDEVLDYIMNWPESRIGNDIVVGSTWIVPDGITVDDETFDDHSATVWLSGGSPGMIYTFLNRVVTAGGRTYDETVRIVVRER